MEDFDQVKGKPSPRRGIQVQGSRPARLKISHKIKKPSLPPPQASASQRHRPPVIIYTVSPKIIHTKPSEFMSLVQRLTGCPSSSGSTDVDKGDELINSKEDGTDDLSRVLIGGNSCSAISRSTSLQTIPPNFLSPSVAEVNQISFLDELYPDLHGGKGLMDNSFLASTGNFFFSL